MSEVVPGIGYIRLLLLKLVLRFSRLLVVTGKVKIDLVRTTTGAPAQ